MVVCRVCVMQGLDAGEMLYVEKWFEFDKELAVMVARNAQGDVTQHSLHLHIQLC